MPRIMPRVDDQDDRQVQEFGQGRVAVAAIQLQAVIQAFVAFHQGDVGFLGMAREQGLNFFAPHQVKIQIAAGTSGRSGQPHRIDIVRALLKRLNFEAARAQGGGQPDADGGFARGFMGGGDEEAAHGTLGVHGIFPAGGRLSRKPPKKIAFGGHASSFEEFILWHADQLPHPRGYPA